MTDAMFLEKDIAIKQVYSKSPRSAAAAAAGAGVVAEAAGEGLMLSCYTYFTAIYDKLVAQAEKIKCI